MAEVNRVGNEVLKEAADGLTKRHFRSPEPSAMHDSLVLLSRACLMLMLAFVPSALSGASDTDPGSEALRNAGVLASNMKFQALIDQTPFTVHDDLHRALREANPGREDGVSAFFQVEVMPILLTQDFDYLESLAETLVQRFTADELGRILAFFQTTAGQELLQELPSMRMEMNVVSLTAQRKLRTDVLKAIAPRARHYGIRLPEQ
jgi:hypothetical protein